MTWRAGRRLFVVSMAAAVVAACGKKGPPVPPERRLPAAATGLTARIEDDAIAVSWNVPRTRADGSALRNLAEVTLYRREESDGAPVKPAMLASDRVVGYDRIAAIRLDPPPPAVVRGNRAEWIDHAAATPGHRFVYVVTATDATGRTGLPSERLVVPFLVAPRPPTAVEATAGDRQVTITWQAPSELADGSPMAGPIAYAVLRGTGRDGPLAAIGAGPVAGTSYTDRDVDNDTEYRYAVRAVRVDPRVTAAGAPSETVVAAPADTTPPSAPTNLVAVPSPGAIRLAWTASPEPDVAFYALYRAAGTGPFVRITTTPAATTTFVDGDVRAGVTYRYAVTAIDRARHANESARSDEARAALP